MLDSEYHNLITEDKTYSVYQYAPVMTYYPAQNISIYRGVKQFLEDGDESKLNEWTKDNVKSVTEYLDGDDSKWASYFWAGPKGSLRVFDYYLNNDLRLLNGYLKADTETMGSKGATLEKLRLETFTQIIMGTEPIDAFDEYVENWNKLGGEDITKEINENR